MLSVFTSNAIQSWLTLGNQYVLIFLTLQNARQKCALGFGLQ